MRREAGLPQPWLRGLGPGGAGNAGAARWLPQVMFRINRALRGVQHEVVELELPDYHRLNGGEEDPASPPDFFRGETSKWGAITDLDGFFQRVYQYYCDKGFWCICTQWLCELVSLAFTISFSGFLLLYVNWAGLLSAKCGIDAINEGHVQNCDLAKEALYEHPLTPFTALKAFYVIYLVLFSIYWLFCFVRFFTQLRDTLEVQSFIHNSLGVTEHELQTMTWPVLVDKIVQLQQHERLCIVRQLSAHDIVSRIMRKENYLIGLLNKGVLGLDLPQWVPGAGPILSHDRKRLVLSKMVEWSLNWCILHYMFDRNFLIRRDFTNNPERLRQRLKWLGISMLILSPFYVVFMAFYFLLRNAELFYHNPSAAGSRRWSNLAKWTFREFNELEHMFKHRLNTSYKHAVEYVKQFPSPIISMIAKLVAYVTGAFAAILIGIALIDESLMEGHIGSRQLFWYTAIFASVLQISRSLIMEEYQVFDPKGVMQQVTKQTHYMPKHWRGAENTEAVRAEFEGHFQYKATLFFEEISSIIVTPFILIFAFPKCVDDVLQFVHDFTVRIEGVGDVCSLSVFDFEHHGNSKYGSPFHTSKDRRSAQGKMEKSFLSFKTNYPNWEPDGNGKQFMSVLADFRHKNCDNDPAMAHMFSSLHVQPPPNQLRPWGEPTSGHGPYIRSEPSSVRDRFGNLVPFTLPYSTNEMIPDLEAGRSQGKEFYESPVPNTADQLYWLDKFYTASQSVQSAESELSTDERLRGLVMDGSSRRGGVNIDRIVVTRGADTQRLTSQVGVNMQASSNEILGNQGYMNAAGDSRWWLPKARMGAGSTDLPASSFEPPMLGGGYMGESQDDPYESEEDPDRSSALAPHIRGAFASSQISEDENASLEFPFGDVYQRPHEDFALGAADGLVGMENRGG